jgi:hypothetical protein
MSDHKRREGDPKVLQETKDTQWSQGIKVTADHFKSPERKAAFESVRKQFGLPDGAAISYFPSDDSQASRYGMTMAAAHAITQAHGIELAPGAKKKVVIANLLVEREQTHTEFGIETKKVADRVAEIASLQHGSEILTEDVARLRRLREKDFKSHDSEIAAKDAEIASLRKSSSYWEKSFQLQVKVAHSRMLELDAKNAQIANLKATSKTVLDAVTDAYRASVEAKNKDIDCLLEKLAVKEGDIASLKQTAKPVLDVVNDAYSAGVESQNKAVNELVQKLAERDAKIVGIKEYSKAGEKEIAALKRELADHQQAAKPTTLALNRAYVKGVDAQKSLNADAVEKLTKTKELALVRSRRDKWQSASPSSRSRSPFSTDTKTCPRHRD